MALRSGRGDSIPRLEVGGGGLESVTHSSPCSTRGVPPKSDNVGTAGAKVLLRGEMHSAERLPASSQEAGQASAHWQSFDARGSVQTPVLVPVQEGDIVTNPNAKEPSYNLQSVKLPHLTGLSLRLVVALAESPFRHLLLPSLLKNAGVTGFREREFDEPPTQYPLASRDGQTGSGTDVQPLLLPDSQTRRVSGFNFTTVHDFARAYREGHREPEQVAARVLEAIDASEAIEPPLAAIHAWERNDILRQAAASGERFRSGVPLSVIDGVPVLIKDEFDMVPYPRMVGTTYMGGPPVQEDATVVSRLREAGALLIGKANMTEIGIGVTGLNLHHGTPRNPYNPDHYTGGSCSGPAAAVAAGLCPIAIGADGGGSVRAPASFCGLVGLKATFGRVSEHGAAPTNWSVAHIGPLAATATDIALAYGVIAGPDPQDPMSLHQPAPTLAGWDNLDLSDLTLGVYWPWFRHASADVVSACERLLGAFEEMGAEVREVVIPDLEEGRVAHLVSIGCEMAQALDRYDNKHRREWGLDVRLNMALLREISARDFVQAQRVRTRLMTHFDRVLEKVDLIITPTTGIPAPAIPTAALTRGESDLTTLSEIMRFVTPANLTGLPAISFPAGYTDAGLPIGMQAIGHAWQEPTLFRIALAAEQAVERQPPIIHFDVLGS